MAQVATALTILSHSNLIDDNENMSFQFEKQFTIAKNVRFASVEAQSSCIHFARIIWTLENVLRVYEFSGCFVRARRTCLLIFFNKKSWWIQLICFQGKQRLTDLILSLKSTLSLRVKLETFTTVNFAFSMKKKNNIFLLPFWAEFKANV